MFMSLNLIFVFRRNLLLPCARSPMSCLPHIRSDEKLLLCKHFSLCTERWRWEKCVERWMGGGKVFRCRFFPVPAECKLKAEKINFLLSKTTWKIWENLHRWKSSKVFAHKCWSLTKQMLIAQLRAIYSNEDSKTFLQKVPYTSSTINEKHPRKNRKLSNNSRLPSPAGKSRASDHHENISIGMHGGVWEGRKYHFTYFYLLHICLNVYVSIIIIYFIQLNIFMMPNFSRSIFNSSASRFQTTREEINKYNSCRVIFRSLCAPTSAWRCLT